MTLKTKDLTGRVVVVTGAGSGIGRELAVHAARRGATLSLCDRDEAGLEQTLDLVRSSGANAEGQVVDVSDAEQMAVFGKTTIEQFGAPDLLINNAGIAVIGGILDTTLADWGRLLGVNVMGVVHGINAFVPAMAERGGGHVVNVASAAGLLANPQLGGYSATKHAVVGLSEALRIELAPHGVGVTAVCPGIIDTAITRNSAYRGGDAAARKAKTAKTYARRGYTPARAAANILKAVDRNRAVAPIAPEAHVMYVLSRIAPPLARRLSALMAKVAE
ncbi:MULTISPECIES: SDR family NAD(P)-dependent oxidoreductase [Mycobacteriaceae]|jgi:short-subunit dehydrogenase|uniref:Short-chain dehydrogenase n=1 Tax=Mycolicibacterium fluoranthenivorans TaxID=258505 RepID=A0A1G4V7C2_9MYCO|nr:MULTISPECIES: SDR family NAD(P)-dependent oxidoreductase [Mycobacteriaceae]MCV7254848.1 SDR family NAD(P)-dependent oxidoreductase [Mycobacterium hackensackense]SCX02394.1 Short-chain dehydrogenase [Mycolicibacterium fluoranthenivorans]